MELISVFDIVGPIMIGPSSSHTAGAVKLAYIARKIFGLKPQTVKFYLHGSFADTYKGHGTDRALIGGILLFTPDDESIRHSFEIAKEQQIEFAFIKSDLGDVHPNTVRIEMSADDVTLKITGCSVGGGRIEITKINSMDVEITCEYATLITKHKDKPGAIAKITTILADYDINIAFMKVFRKQKGTSARLIVEIDGDFDIKAMDRIRDLEFIKHAQFIESLKL